MFVQDSPSDTSSLSRSLENCGDENVLRGYGQPERQTEQPCLLTQPDQVEEELRQCGGSPDTPQAGHDGSSPKEPGVTQEPGTARLAKGNQGQEPLLQKLPGLTIRSTADFTDFRSKSL